MANIGNVKNFFVTWFDESSGYATSSDITADVSGVSFTDTGSGKINSAVLKLSGAFGNFITDKGTPIVIDQYDRFRIQAEDLNGNKYDRYFEFIPLIIPSQTKTEGTQLELDLVGLEYHTQRINYAGRHWFANGFDVAAAIGRSYNKNKKVRQPILNGHEVSYSQSTKIGNGFPTFTVNQYEFGVVQSSGYNRWNQLTDSFQASVDLGGILDIFELSFETPAVNQIDIAIFSAGSRTNDHDVDGSLPTIKQSQATNIGSTEVGIAAATATQVAAWGSQTQGSLPTGASKYVSGTIQFEYRPPWVSGTVYRQNSLVKHLGKHYISLVDNNNQTPGNPSFWTQIDMASQFGNTTQYSEWTDDKVREWANCGSNPSSVTQVGETITSVGACMFDCNIAILDNTPEAKFFRTWVDFIATSDATISTAATNWAYGGLTTQFPVGRRCLVNGTGSGVFSGSDSNGVPFSNNIAEWDGDAWVVKYRPTQSAVDLDTMQCVVLDENQVYQYEASTTSWSIVGGDLYSDCLHKYTKIEATTSFDPKPTETNFTSYPAVTKLGGTFAKNINSTITITYDVTTNHQSRILAGSANPLGEYFSGGAWLVWRVPFSPNNYGTSVTIGNLYGTATPLPGKDNLQPSFLDRQNMTHTSRGTVGFSQPNSEDLGPIQGISQNITVTSKSLTGGDLDGINRIRIWMIDRYDSTVYFDVDVPFVNTSFPINVAFDSFKPYRGKLPRFFQRSGNISLTELLPQELEQFTKFAWREIQIIGWQIQDFYDEFDRYAPDIFGDLQDFNIDNTSLSKTFGSKITLGIDNFHFIKPLLAIAVQPGSTRNLEADFRKRPNVIVFDQLLNDAAAELEKEQFQLKRYQLETAGPDIFSLKFGDGFFFENDQLVNDQDDSTDMNAKKIKLVVKNIDYNLTSPGGNSQGGLTRNITALKRFI